MSLFYIRYWRMPGYAIDKYRCTTDRSFFATLQFVRSTCAGLCRSARSKSRRQGNDRSLNYRSFPRITVIDPAGSVYMPSGVAAIVMFLSSEGVLQYCTRATDPTNGWLTCWASSMTR